MTPFETMVIECLSRIANAVERRAENVLVEQIRRTRQPMNYWAEIICDKRGTALCELKTAGRRLEHVFTRELVTAKLLRESWSQQQIAETLGVHHTTIHHMTKRIDNRHAAWLKLNDL